jgi:hypothetical protein
VGLLYSDALSYFIGNLSAVKTLALMSYSYERISYVGTLVLMVRFFVEVIVFFCAKVCKSTTGEYIHTQQALTIGWK